MTALRDLERASIRAFVESCSEQLSGRVLDYGAGRMPYRDLVEQAGAEYHAFDRTNHPASVAVENLTPSIKMTEGSWDAILVTQVLQYIVEPRDLLDGFYRWLRPGGFLVLTGKTNWPEVEQEDLYGLTLSGARSLLEGAGFAVERLERRASITVSDFEFSLGYGAVARRPNLVIYALVDPDDGQPRYVGQTEKSIRRRLRGHINESRRSSRAVSTWIRSLDVEPEIRVLEVDPEDGNVAERQWYQELVRQGCDLLNASVGNRGAPTRTLSPRQPMSEEQRQKVSEFFRGRPKTSTSNALRSISASQRRPSS